MADNLNVARTAVSPRRMLVPLALAQFICSFAGSNMNVMINDISKDLDTTVYGVGALLSAVSPGLGILILGNSLLEGFGSALLIPPVYILTTLLFTDLQ